MQNDTERALQMKVDFERKTIVESTEKCSIFEGQYRCSKGWQNDEV